MTEILTALPPDARVAVIRLRSLGDCVLTTPALRILKAHRPDLRVAVVVEPRFAAIFEGNPDVETILPPTVATVAKWSPLLAINLHGGTRSMVLTAATRARWRAGFDHHSGASLYNVPVPRAQEILGAERTVHTAEHLASVMFYLGAPLQLVPRAPLFATPSSRVRPYAVIHPVAATPEKTWPAENFLQLATSLQLTPVFLGAPTDNLVPFRDFDTQVGTLSEAKNLLAGASLFIGNDSGPAHMAAAFGVPSMVLFGPSDEKIWHPWQVQHQVLKGTPISSISLESVTWAAQQLGVPQ